LPAGFKSGALQPLAGETAAFHREDDGWRVDLPPASFAVVKVK
jgi:hypothetical protein